MNRTIKIFLSIALMVVFQLPGKISACAMHSSAPVEKEMSCCSSTASDHDQSEKTDDCCKTTQSGTDCSGSCGQSSCHSPSSTFWMLDLKHFENEFPFEKEELYSLYRQPYYSAGFHSIWQPPKIK